MMMLDQEELQEILNSLTSSDINECATMLTVLATDPTGDLRILPALTALLDDQRACIVQIPIMIAEIRWLAGHALAAEHQTAGIDRKVTLRDVVCPITPATLTNLMDAVYGPQHERLPPLHLFEKLQADRKLPTVDLVFG